MKAAALILLSLIAGLTAGAQITLNDTVTMQTGPDTLTAGVSRWETTKTRPTPYGQSRLILKGATRDLSGLTVLMHTLSAGRSFSPAPGDAADHLLIVREGSITVDDDTLHKVLGPGGVGLFAAGDLPAIHNTGKANAVFYLFSFRSRSPVDPQRAKQAGPPLVVDWPGIPMKTTDKGESRPIFSRPVAWLSKIDMHATTLNPGEISHPQHIHRNEEIILMRSGHVRMHIANGYQPATDGDLVFLASGVPHNLENGNTGRAEYFALQWEQ